VLLVYNFIIRLYALAIRLASFWRPKAKQWVDGRKNLFEELEKKINSGDKIIWFHSGMSAEFREEALAGLRTGKYWGFFCTDAAGMVR